MHILKHRNNDTYYGYPVQEIVSIPGDSQTSLEIVVDQSQVGFCLSFSDLHHSVWISCNVVLKSNTNRIDKLKAKTTFFITITSSTNIQELGIKLPHFIAHFFLFVTMIRNQCNTIDSFFDWVKAISSKTVEEARVYDSFNLWEKVSIALNNINDSSHWCEGSYCCQDWFSIIIISILVDASNILLLKMLTDVNSIWLDVVSENCHDAFEGRY